MLKSKDRSTFRLREIAYCGASMVAGLFVGMPEHSDFQTPPPWYVPLGLASLIFAGTFALLTLVSSKSENGRSGSGFESAGSGWMAGDASQNVRIGAMCILCGGFGNLIHALLVGGFSWGWLIPVSGGLGALLACRVANP
jgi:hypothetical protein